jgi:hypothetical protein
MESDITVFVGVLLVKRPSPATCAGDDPALAHPISLLFNRFFAALFQSLNRVGLAIAHRKERWKPL